MDTVKREEATAFAPCHVTAFFVPNIEPKEPMRTGSWGAGLCLGTGVVASVEIMADAPGAIKIDRGGDSAEAATTREAVRLMLRDHEVGVRCTVHEGAPVGQGFGVSGASALASAFAVGRCLGMGRSQALQAAHLAEVRNRSGLSDASASFVGGVVLRTSPGLPPFGASKRLPARGDVVVATVGPSLETGSLLRDETVMGQVSQAGRSCMEAVNQRPTLETVIEQGARFAREIDLVEESTLRAVDACQSAGQAMVAMLGNTVVAYGDMDGLVDVLEGFGDPHVVPIDDGGLRLFDREALDQALSS